MKNLSTNGSFVFSSLKLIACLLGVLMLYHYFIISHNLSSLLSLRNSNSKSGSETEVTERASLLPNNFTLNLQLPGSAIEKIREVVQSVVQAAPDAEKPASETGYYSNFGVNSKFAPFRAEKSEEFGHLFSEKSPRVAVITYVPYRDDHFYLMQYSAILHSSWRYVIDHPSIALKAKFKSHPTLSSDLVIADMLVFCDPKACKELPEECTKYVHEVNPKDPIKYPLLHRCYYFEATEHPYAKDYGWTNSFIFADHPDYHRIQHLYSYIFRLDTDCLVTPPFLSYVPPPERDIIIENWGYCTDFNKQRLQGIAAKLNLTHQKEHCIGSSFYLRPQFMEKVAPLTMNLTIHIAKHEFEQNLPGLEPIFANNTNPDGIWPTWWRGVSLLYGTELAINHLVPNLKQSWVDGLVDEDTCSDQSIMSMVQLHSFHGACQFRKFDFMDALKSIRLKTKMLDPRLLMYYDDRDVSRMSQRDYAMFIAWYGAGHFVRQVRGWTAVALGHKEPDPEHDF